MEVQSPCIDICTLGPGDVCVGCGRHIEEIAAWGGAPAEVKRRIVEAAERRLAQMQPPAPTQARAR